MLLTFFGPMKEKFIITVLAANFLTSCSSTYVNRGTNLAAEDIKKIVVGQTTKETVESLFGTPSTISHFPDDKGTEHWFYIWKKLKEASILKPTVVEQKMVAISFNSANKVSSLRVEEGIKGNLIKPHTAVTPTQGQDISLMREVFSNFGRFTEKKKEPGA